MSSTGAIALVASGLTKVTYGYANSEPDFLGWDLASMVKSMLNTAGQEAAVKTQVAALTGLPTTPISQATLDAWLATHPHPEIVTVDDLYAAIDGMQGNIPATLNFGVYKDYITFTGDPGLTQVDWGYCVDFDLRVFEIYRGQQLTPPTRGRLVGLPRATALELAHYYPLQMVSTFTFAQVKVATLPTRWWATT